MYPGKTASSHPDRAAVIMAGTGETISYGELEARSNRLAHLLRARGLRRLDHYSIYMENHPRYVEACAAGERSGHYYTCINSFLTVEELAYILQNSQSKVLIASQAKREVALAAGEPPAARGFPPSVFAKLPALVERAGNGSDGQGSITAFFTVLTEGDDLQDPIADAARAILDGHIVLARELADAGHYPAIDIEKSISRVMPMVTSPEHMELARTFKQFYSLYQQNRDLITIGAYSQGSDPRIDRAIIQKPYLDQFLQQKMREVIHYDEGLQSLQLVAMPLMR